ncbi:MAG: DNA mismatch repair endonuclease MutL [Planctomycetaceae bacterium]|jgi:DNA mismatch repair protein MutL|nr:DNA mismatch repair endonuclease MutL [Planctomycetaceae bacterium]
MTVPTIHLLSQSMINKIAAGEVIERPASAVKELVENAVDAGASRIDISIENGGADLIRVVDNGCGIAAAQLDLALSPHATSKIVSTDDLFKITTFGFRGEALASIAEISQLTLKSRSAETPEGSVIQCNGGERNAPQACGLPAGTQIDVRNLFFNVPVRRKYMRSTTTEFGHITETFFRLVLPLAHIHFTLKHNGRTVYDLPPVNGQESQDTPVRIRQLFGEEVARDLMVIAPPPNAPVKVSGFVSHPNLNRPNNRLQYFFLNQRFIRDRSLQHALNEAYRGMLLTGRFPIAFLHVEMPPELFDVNVHPTKMEVRFLDANRVYGGFLGTIREKFLQTDLRNTVRSDALPAADTPSVPDSTPDENVRSENIRRSTVKDWMSKIEASNNTVIDSGRDANVPAAGQSGGSFSLKKRSAFTFYRISEAHPAAARCVTARDVVDRDIVEDIADRAALTASGHAALQMLNRYIVLETDNGIALIDQHALHERILYEQMKERMNTGRLESQRLLVPVPLDLLPAEYAETIENADFLKTFGLEAEPFGGNTVLISAFPAILSKTPPQEILLTMLETLAGEKSAANSSILDEMLHRLACKAAVKAGDKMNSASMMHLLELAEKEIHSHHCPHGRPSTLVFTVEEIDKMFLRSG